MNFHGGDVYSCKGEVLDFSSNINPLGVPASFREALWEQMDDFTRYPDLQYRALRKSFADYLSFDQPDMIIPGNGAVEIIFKGIMALDIDALVNLSPTFSEYAHAASQKGIQIVDINAYDEDYQHLDLDHVLTLIQPKSLVVLCNPNNPTGTMVEKEEICALAGALKENECYLLIDEAFIEFTDGYPQNSMVSELARFPNVLIIRAATKFFGMPGIRLGFGITRNTALVQGIKAQLEPWNVNAAAVIAGCIVYQDQEYIAASRLWIQQERKFLFDRLQEIPGLTVYSSQVNYHLVRMNKEKIDAWKLKELLLEKGILIRSPDGFHHLSPYHFRLAVKDRVSNEKMLAALREVCAVYG